MRQRRLASIALLAIGGVIAAGGLTGCSSNSGSTDAGSGSSDSGTISFEVYQDLRAKTAEALIPKFEAAMKKQGKNIKVNLIKDVLTDQQFTTKITQQYHAGTAPDVVDMGQGYVNQFAGAGYLLPLDDYLKKWSGWSTYYPVIKTAMTSADGKTYGLPHEASVLQIFYRKDVLQRLGVDTSQPATWADLTARLKQITAKTGKPAMTLPAGTAWGNGSWGEGFGNIVAGTSEKIYNASTKKWNVSGSNWSDTFDLYSTLKAENLLPTQDLLNPNPWEPTKYKAFVNGSIPISTQGTWGWKYDWGSGGSAPIADLTSKVSTWKFPALQAGGEPYASLSVGNTYVVSANTKHASAAMQFAEWMSSGSAVANQLTAIGAAAPRTGIDTIAPYSNDPQLLDAEKQFTGAVIVPTEDGVEQVSQAVQNATEDILTGKANGAQATAEFTKQATDLLGASRVSS